MLNPKDAFECAADFAPGPAWRSLLADIAEIRPEVTFHMPDGTFIRFRANTTLHEGAELTLDDCEVLEFGNIYDRQGAD